MLFLDTRGAHILILGLRHLGAERPRMRASGRTGGPARLPAFRHGADVAATSGRCGDGHPRFRIKRSEVFVVTKVAPDHLAPGLLERSVKESTRASEAWRDRSPAAALAEQGHPAERDRSMHWCASNARAGSQYRCIELYRGVDRGSGKAFRRTAGLQPDRVSPLSRSV